MQIVAPRSRRDRRGAGDILVAALADDPGWRQVLPEAAARRVALRTIIEVALTDAGPQVRLAVDGERIVGAAVWQPPGRYPMGVWRQLRAVPRMLPMLARIGRRAQDVQRFGAGIDMRFPGDPVRYLQVLGVDPAVQRRGVGSALLREGLAAADTAGDDVYLETGRQANVAYYERHGFALVAPGEALWDGGPVLWRMRRSVTVR